MDEITVDWTTADVTDGTLKVELSAKPPAEWLKQFERTVKLLNHATWTVKLAKHKIHVVPVAPGEEADIRHFLESLLLEANSTLEVDEDSDADDATSAGDREMTERLRSFAEPAE